MHQIVIETHPNLHYRTYHARTVLAEGFKSATAAMSRVESGVVADLIAIPGVAEVNAWCYQAGVTKGQAFSWDEVEPAVLSVLSRAASPEGDPDGSN